MDTTGTICTPAPEHLANDSTEPNMSIPDPQGSISTTTNSPVYSTTATADLWRKVARKAAKITYQHKYYGTILRMPVLTQARVQPVMVITPTIFDLATPVATPVSTPVPPSVLIPVPTQITTEPITDFDSDTTAPVPTPTQASTSIATMDPSSATTGLPSGGDDEKQQKKAKKSL